MKLGWKLFCCFWAFPWSVCALRINAARGMERLGAELSEHVGAFLMREAQGRMADLVEDHALLLRAKRDILGLRLTLQADAVKKRLFGPVPESAAGASFQVRVRRMGMPKSGSGPEFVYMSLGPDGMTRLAKVPDKGLLFSGPPGESLTGLRDGMSRLSLLEPDFAGLDRPDDPPMWRLVALTGGLTAVTLRDGKQPGLFDPRDSFWFRSALAAGPMDDPVWTPPYIVPALERIVMTVSTAVRDAAGQPAAVTAITTPLDDMLAGLTPGGHISHELASFLVTAVRPDDGGDRQLLAAAGSRPLRGRHGWLTRWSRSRSGPRTGRFFAEVARDVPRGNPGCAGWPSRDATACGPMPRPGRPRPCSRSRRCRRSCPKPRPRRPMWSGASRTSGLFRAGAGLVMLVLVPATLFGARTVTRPAADLARAARRLAQGDFSARAHPRGRDELAELGGIFNDMAPQLADRVRMRESLELAMEVQHRLLPKSPPRLPGLDMAAISIYCDETGGDYYDFFEFADRKPSRRLVWGRDRARRGRGPAMATAGPCCGPARRRAARRGRSWPGEPGQTLTPWAREGSDPVLSGDRPVGPASGWPGRHDRPVHDPAPDLRGARLTGDTPGIVEDAAYEDKDMVASRRGGAGHRIRGIGRPEIRGEMFGKTACGRWSGEIRSGAAAVLRPWASPAISGGGPQEDHVTLVVAAFTT
jgi:sigma-B regulation protein RsbU (phosphoserine phosphatase)